MRVNLKLESSLNTARELIAEGHPNLWIRRVVTKDNKGEPFKENVDRLLGGVGYKVSEHFCFDRGDNKFSSSDDSGLDRTYCGYPSQRLMISSDGMCYACCVDTDGEMPMGKFPDQSILEVWNGEPFRKLRDELKKNMFCSKACKGCQSWMSYKAPQRDSVQDKAI
jgi:radical SAM protein with 4Fe4S-binding SPASM domain